MSRSVQIGLSVAISAIFLALAVSNVDWVEALTALRKANYLWILPTFPITAWTLYVRAQRWRVFLHPMRIPALRHLIAATNIGFMANMVFPLRAGEVIRPVLVSRRQGLPMNRVLASVLLERIFDMFTILLLFGVSATFVYFESRSIDTKQIVDAQASEPVFDAIGALAGFRSATKGAGQSSLYATGLAHGVISPLLWKSGVTLMALAFGVGSLMVFMRLQRNLALRILRLLCSPLPEHIASAISNFAEGFIQALELMESPGSFLRAFAWTLYLWAVIALIYAVAIIAFDLQVPLVIGSVLLTAIVAVAVSVPSAPGYFGTFQFGCIAALAIFGVPKSEAAAFSIVVHLTQFIAVIAAGLYSLWTENMSLRDVESVEHADGAGARS